MLRNFVLLSCLIFSAGCADLSDGIKVGCDKPRIYTPKIVGDYKPVFKPNQTRPERQGQWYTNDHCFIKGDDGQWHAYGIIGKKPASPWGGEKNLFHVSGDSLMSNDWVEHEYALSVDPAYDRVLWAPHAIKHGDMYYMYYAGGNRQENANTYCSWGTVQVSTSKDLFNWTRSESNPIISEPGHARDAYLVKFDNEYYMYYTRTYDEVDHRSTVAVRRSPDLEYWSSFKRAHIQPLKNDWGGDAESPYVVKYKGLYYLFVCIASSSYDVTCVYWSENPLDFPRENLVCKLDSHAPEVLYDEKDGWFISTTGWNKDGLYIAKMVWE